MTDIVGDLAKHALMLAQAAEDSFLYRAYNSPAQMFAEMRDKSDG